MKLTNLFEMDAQLRTMERDKQRGENVPPSQLLLNRVRAGEVPEENVRMAAKLGLGAARGLFPHEYDEDSWRVETDVPAQAFAMLSLRSRLDLILGWVKLLAPVLGNSLTQFHSARDEEMRRVPGLAMRGDVEGIGALRERMGQILASYGWGDPPKAARIVSMLLNFYQQCATVFAKAETDFAGLWLNVTYVMSLVGNGADIKVLAHQLASELVK